MQATIDRRAALQDCQHIVCGGACRLSLECPNFPCNPSLSIFSPPSHHPLPSFLRTSKAFVPVPRLIGVPAFGHPTATACREGEACVYVYDDG